MTLDEQIEYMRSLALQFLSDHRAHEGARALQAQDAANADACAAVVVTLQQEKARREAVGADWA